MTRRFLGPVAALVTLAVLGGSGAAVAAWSASASVNATASSASPATTIAQSGALTTTYQYTGSSSTTVLGSLTIKNTGGTPLERYTLANDVTGDPALAQKTTLRLWTGNCATVPGTGVITTTLANTAPDLPVAARSLAAGASVVVCVATRIEGGTNAELQGRSVTSTFRVTGAVGTSWTATATAGAITQSVYRLASVDKPSCANRLGQVLLSWPAPANRPTGAPMTYTVNAYDKDSRELVKSFPSTGATLTINALDLMSNGTYDLAVVAKEGTYNTTAEESTPVSVSRTGFWIFGALTCLA